MNVLFKSEKTLRIAKFFIPFILGFGVYGIWWLLSSELSKIWPLIIAYFFPPFGKETIIPLGIGVLDKGINLPLLNLHVEPTSINPISMALSIAFIDIVVALFLVWNYDLAKKIPIIGKFIIKVEEKGNTAEEKYRWIKPLRFIGIILFVMVPFQGSGGLVGSIVGRLFGMNPWNTFIAISIGSVTGCLLIAMFSKTFLVFAEINTTVTLILIGIIAAVILLYFGIRKIRKK